MARSKYQVLILPYCINKDGEIEYCVFKRSDIHVWQFISGGGEDFDSSILETARRECYEEAKIPEISMYIELETTSSISTECFKTSREIWGNECLVIPEYTFAVKLENKELQISEEHKEYRWVTYEEAIELLRYDSNKVALWELDNKIRMGII